MARDEVVDELSTSPEELASVLGSAPAVNDVPQELTDAEPAAEEAEQSETKGFFDEADAAASKQVGVHAADSESKFKFRVGEKELELSAAEVQERLSAYESGKVAPAAESKYKREMAAREAKIQELQSFKENWDKLEALKQDKRQLIETITGESFDELVQREAERAEIKKYGTEEQKRALLAEERAERVERELNAERETRKREAEAIEQRAKEVAQAARLSAMEREYYKHELPPGLNEYDQEVLKDALWSRAQRTIAKYEKEYGTVTNKMIAKAFQDTANALYRTTSKQVEVQLKTTREKEKADAKAGAQIAATRPSDPWESKDVSKLTPRKLFDLFRNKA